MKYLKNKIPPPLVALLFGLLVWQASKLSISLTITDEWRMGSTYTLIALGILFNLAAVISFKMAKTTVNPIRPESASSLVKSGIFKLSRNPMYVGMALFLAAWSAYLASPFSIILIIGFILYMTHFQIKAEEQALTILFGEEYLLYKQQVRRWI
ncbi:MAG: methyltransferase family protein [Cellvibrionaceae bacterium]